MRSRLTRSEWTAAAVLIVAAAALLAWAVGLPGRRLGEREGSSAPAEETLRKLVELAPAPGARGFPQWRRLAQLGPPEPRASGRLGFDGARLIIRRDDGAVRWRVGLLLDHARGDARPAALVVECLPADPRSPWVARELRRRWPFDTRDAGAGWRARWRDPRAAAEVEARARALLGGHRPVDVPDALADAYGLLLDPLRPIVYAPPGPDPCGPEPGRVALERLLAAGRDDLVRNVLRGLDPEGRVYAAEALLGRIEPDEDDEVALERLLELDEPVRLRDGSRCTPRSALGTRAAPVDPRTD